MRILLIYEMIPEETKFFLFENVNPNSELHKHLLGAHGHYANYDGENESTEFLNTYLFNYPEVRLEDVPKLGSVDMVVHSGFGL